MNVSILAGNEPFSFNSANLPFSVQEFWAWNGSNLLSNTFRGALAEFIVAEALGVELDRARDDWTAYDLAYQFGGRVVPIEVKSSAYLQAWEQSKLTDIRFDIAPSREWKDQKYVGQLKRHSDIYVFCLFAFRDIENKDKANPLDLSQWEFFALPTFRLGSLDRSGGDVIKYQRSISQKGLLGLNPIRCTYMTLRESVNNAISQIPAP